MKFTALHGNELILCLFIYLYIDLFFPFFFLEPHPWHMEVPRLEVKLELYLLAYATATTMRDPSLYAAYTTAHGNAGSLTHCMRPGIEPEFSWMLVRFIYTEP